MDYKLYGFLIGNDIHFDIENKQLYRISSNGSEKNIIFGTIFFNDTMLHLLVYMLVHGRNNHISKDELLEKIWEENKLSPSSQRLWQVLTALNKKLQILGLPEDFIKNVKGSGYIIEHTEIKPLYLNKRHHEKTFHPNGETSIL